MASNKQFHTTINLGDLNNNQNNNNNQIEMSKNSFKYSVILPTYQERKNLPIIIWLLARTFNEQ